MGEPAERLSLQLGRAAAPCQLEALLVLGQAVLDPAAREIEVAAQEVDPGQLLDQVMPLRHFRRALEVGKGAIQLVGDPFDGRQP
jgi:hypothetical protein